MSAKTAAMLQGVGFVIGTGQLKLCGRMLLGVHRLSLQVSGPEVLTYSLESCWCIGALIFFLHSQVLQRMNAYLRRR